MKLKCGLTKMWQQPLSNDNWFHIKARLLYPSYLQHCGNSESEEKQIIWEAKMMSLSNHHDDANAALNYYDKLLKIGARLLHTYTKFEEFDIDNMIYWEDPKIFFVPIHCPTSPLWSSWMVPSHQLNHTQSAGIDFVTPSLSLATSQVCMTNARGQFSSTLGEHTLMAWCTYYAKDVPRLMPKEEGHNSLGQVQANVLELCGMTMGIVGYGDIGQACAKLAQHIFRMQVIALKCIWSCHGMTLCVIRYCPVHHTRHSMDSCQPPTRNVITLSITAISSLRRRGLQLYSWSWDWPWDSNVM